jgi:hypothetical protein
MVFLLGNFGLGSKRVMLLFFITLWVVFRNARIQAEYRGSLVINKFLARSWIIIIAGGLAHQIIR